MTHERLTKPSLDIPPARASSHDEDPAASTVTPSSVDKMLASISHDSVIGGLGTTAEAGPTPGAQISRADQAALDATRPALVLWTQRITQATRQVEDAAKNPDRAAVSRRVTEIIQQLSDDAAGELLRTLVGRVRVDPSAIALELGDAARAVDGFKIAVFYVDSRLDVAAIVGRMDQLAKRLGFRGWWAIAQPQPLQGPVEHSEVKFAGPFLDSALADAKEMESLIQIRGTQADKVRLRWIDTLNALVSTLPKLTKDDRKILRTRARELVTTFNRLKAKDRAEIGIDSQQSQISQIEKALLP